jgi:phosphoglycerol transferase MdoB-like AlkP superfamily enzyme
MLFFFINRLVFEIWYVDRLANESFLDILKTFLLGAHMDASMAGYICVIPFLLFFTSYLVSSFSFKKYFVKYYTFLLVFLTSLFTLIDINIYREWGTKFNYRAIEFFLTSTGDAMASSSSSPVFASFSTIGILTIIGVWIYKWTFDKSSYRFEKIKFYIKAPLAILFLGFTFLAIRGGIGVAPMNPSKVYFSEKQVLNFAAINTNWFLMANTIANQKSKANPYVYFGESQRKQILDSLFFDDDKTYPIILKSQKPNIVLIMMESFTADLVAELGGEVGVTPKFSELIKEGLLFEHIYSASDRTDKGLVGIISGFPSQAVRSIVKENDKQERLPAISSALVKNGYQTSFFYGGDTDFSNFKSYLLSHNYQLLFDLKSLSADEIGSVWGAFDEVIFKKQLDFLKSSKQPFFSTLLTLSNHEPFALPTKGKFGDNTLENKFRSTSFYTDAALYNYVNEAKKQPWYTNTLFIVIADHGHRLPKSINDIDNPARYHIPMLFFGGALKSEFEGKRINKYGNQVDLASTLLSQLNIPDSAFHYSKNLLSKRVKGFGFFSYDNGFGYVDKEKAVTFDPVGKQIIFSKPTNLNQTEKIKALNNAKVLMQSVYKDIEKY